MNDLAYIDLSPDALLRVLGVLVLVGAGVWGLCRWREAKP